MVCPDNPVSCCCQACRLTRSAAARLSSIVACTATAWSVEPARSKATTGRAEPPGSAAAGFATATGHAGARDSRSSPARPINSACHRVRDNRHDPICRRSPAAAARRATAQPFVPAQPAAPLARPGLPNRYGVPGLQRPPGVQGAPALQRPGLPAAPRRPAPAPQRGKPPKEQR